MKSVAIALLAGFFVAGSYAQAGPPSAESQVPTNTKPQIAAEQRHEARDARKPGHANTGSGGDAPLSPEISDKAIGKDKAARAAEKRHQIRDARTPGHDVPAQGRTPK